ncbi:sulfotransferase ssu-1-like [Uloborus diversus]|uniref:sulfotransferase ssu-1-like n=1 Tax=Uloborus diversus TaxID=327109 RepID=UPI002409AA75|nr:sulfotransferase ssu-1-like [Uloborus diversus]
MSLHSSFHRSQQIRDFTFHSRKGDSTEMESSQKKPLYHIINGVRIPKSFSPKCFQEAMNYKPTPDDVIIVTYPKCGTTWMQNIALYIYRKGRELEDPKDFFKMAPFIDNVGQAGIDNMPRPGTLKTHLPYNLMPYSPDAKYIFVVRDPRDCCVSLYYHTRNMMKFNYWDATFDDFFEIFMRGEVEYNDYYDHLLSLYPHRNDSQVFFTKYEDMKKDRRKVVIELAKFLGREYIEAIENDNSVLNNILTFTSFEYLQKNLSPIFSSSFNKVPDANGEELSESKKQLKKVMESLSPPENLPKFQFIRKGIVGDWHNHFSPEQIERFTAKFNERTKGTEIQEWYPMK